ncbi:MAG: winged helix-turn-helix domain-containing protein [Sphingomonadaceae bacterium]
MPISLLHAHTKSVVEAASAQRSAQAMGAAEYFDADIGQAFRIVEMPDRAAPLRRTWLAEVVECDQHYNHSQDPAGYLAQAENAFSVLLISGDDIPRIHAIMREVREILPSKAIVPVLRDCSTRETVSLLGRGAADVLHCRMAPVEATARLHALVRRLDWAGSSQMAGLEAEARRQERLRSIAFRRLTPLEERLLTVLVEREERVASYSYIASRVSTYWEQWDSYKSLQVAVCNLRRKLRAGFQIENAWGLGYALKRKPVGILGGEAGHA